MGWSKDEPWRVFHTHCSIRLLSSVNLLMLNVSTVSTVSTDGRILHIHYTHRSSSMSGVLCCWIRENHVLKGLTAFNTIMGLLQNGFSDAVSRSPPTLHTCVWLLCTAYPLMMDRAWDITKGFSHTDCTLTGLCPTVNCKRLNVRWMCTKSFMCVILMESFSQCECYSEFLWYSEQSFFHT